MNILQLWYRLLSGLAAGLILIVCMLLTGCNQSASLPEFLQPAALVIEPVVQQYSDPEINLKDYTTFAVLPRLAVDPKASPGFGNDLLEKQMCFECRNYWEAHGYHYLNDPMKADLWITVDGSNNYQTHYVPPSSITLPEYVPGQVIHSNTVENGTISAYGGYGNYSGNANTTTITPGYWTTQNYTKPGYTVGYFYPSVTMECYDRKTGKHIWFGSGVGTSTNSDVRVSSQIVILNITNKLPRCANAPAHIIPGNGTLGMYCMPFTSDGEHFYPVITKVLPGSPAAKSGLLFGDVVLSIDEDPAENTPLATLSKILTGDIGIPCSLYIQRGKKVIHVMPTRIQRMASETD